MWFMSWICYSVFLPINAFCWSNELVLQHFLPVQFVCEVCKQQLFGVSNISNLYPWLQFSWSAPVQVTRVDLISCILHCMYWSQKIGKIFVSAQNIPNWVLRAYFLDCALLFSTWCFYLQSLHNSSCIMNVTDVFLHHFCDVFAHAV